MTEKQFEKSFDPGLTESGCRKIVLSLKIFQRRDRLEKMTPKY